MRIYAPDGAIGLPPSPLAPPPLALVGRRIGVLENGKPNARLLLTRAAQQLATRTGAVLATVTDKGAGHNAATPCRDDVLEQLAAVDVVLTGSAD